MKSKTEFDFNEKRLRWVEAFKIKGQSLKTKGAAMIIKNKIGLALVVNLITACVATPMKRGGEETRSISSLAAEPARLTDSNQFKPRLLIIKAKMDETKVPKEWQDFAEQDFLDSLDRSGVFVLLKPADLGMDLRDYVLRGQWDYPKIQSSARDKAVPLVLEWELAPLQVRQESDPVGIARERRRHIQVQLKSRMMDTRKGQILGNDLGVAEQEEREVLWWSKSDGKVSVTDYDRMTLEYFLRTAVGNLIPKVLGYASKVAWTGRVAMIKGDRVYINVGRQSGVQVGDLLKVLESGDEVFDPETGDSIGKVPGRMKGTLEVISYFGNDGSIAVVHSGAGFQENDAIEYY